MATADQIARWAAGAEARGVVPHRPIGPPDWQARGALLSFMLGQGFSNEHLGQLPRSDAEFRDWAAAPYVNNHGLRRYWPPGSVDVKSDGHSNPPPWDWNPMGCPGGAGCNDDDWMNHAPWPSGPFIGDGSISGGDTSTGGNNTGGAKGGGLNLGLPTIAGINLNNPAVLGAAAVGLVLLARGR